MDSEHGQQKPGRWVDAGPLEAREPGHIQVVNIGGLKVLVANVDGELLAVADTCTHEDASLATGSLKGDQIKCPLHGSRFCLRTGRALDEPAEVDLECFATRVVNDRVQLFLPE